MNWCIILWFCINYIEFSIKKKRQLVLLSESSDDDDLDTEIQLTSDDLIPLNNEPAVKVSTQQLMNLCSGQFNTQESEAKVNFFYFVKNRNYFLNFNFIYVLMKCSLIGIKNVFCII